MPTLPPLRILIRSVAVPSSNVQNDINASWLAVGDQLTAASFETTILGPPVVTWPEAGVNCRETAPNPVSLAELANKSTWASAPVADLRTSKSVPGPVVPMPTLPADVKAKTFANAASLTEES